MGELIKDIPNYVVRKGEDLVHAKFKLPLIEQRILAVAISKINPQKNTFENPYRFSIKEYCELAGVEIRGTQKVIRDAVESLKSRTLSKYDPSLKRERIFGWLTQADVWDDGNFDLYIHPELTNDLLSKKKYAEYILKNCFAFKSKYSLRFFELVNHWAFQKNKKVHIDVFKEMIGIEVYEYPTYAEFKRRVLLKVINEINEQTEFKIELNEFREKRKVSILEFLISNSAPKLSNIRKKNENTKEISSIENWLNPNNEDIVVVKLAKFGIGAVAAVKLIEEFGLEKIEKSITKVLSDQKEGKLSENVNLSGVLVNKIKDPEPERVNLGSTTDDLKKRRADLMNWFQSLNEKYDPYNFGGNWVGIELDGKIINFMNEQFKIEVDKALKKRKFKLENNS